jgi:hypothetical protein
MKDYGYTPTFKDRLKSWIRFERFDPKPSGCIAFFTLKEMGAEAENTPAAAQQILNLSFEQAQRLFYVYNWPSEYQSRYIGSGKYPTEDAWVAAERIRHFIRTNGDE